MSLLSIIFLLLSIVFASVGAAEVQLRGDAQPRTVLAAPLPRYSTALPGDLQLSGVLRTYLAPNCNSSSPNIALVAPRKGVPCVTTWSKLIFLQRIVSLFPFKNFPACINKFMKPWRVERRLSLCSVLYRVCAILLQIINNNMC